MKIKTQDLTGPALDWAVAKCRGFEGIDEDQWLLRDGIADMPLSAYNPSTDWSQGGPIIEQEGVELICNLNPAEAATFKTEPHWRASKRAWAKGDIWYGPAPLIAAMRCYVASRLGDAVDIPEEMK